MGERIDASEWVRMTVRGLILDPNSDAPVVILREVEGTVFLPIWIGAFEANAIAMAVEGVEIHRPMTHDLLHHSILQLGGKLERVEIHDLVAGTFYARLLVATATGTIDIDARPSDAIALAVRAEAPIWASRGVLQAAVSTSRAADESDEERLREWLANAQPEDLGKYSM